jgi:GTP diphosphokinase / guanosine-3',5'-bis(diphosphate) 3'-diphosphatase
LPEPVTQLKIFSNFEVLTQEGSRSMYNIDLQKEKKEIVKRYRALMRAWSTNKGVAQNNQVRKAFIMASQAHFTMRRRTGEPYIYHPLEVARIVAGEIGLGETAIISALLHDVVEDNPDYTIDMIRQNFGDKVAYIVDGLTKIKDGYERLESTAQVESIKKMLLTLSDDVRVILIKLADRLHNMRTLDSMPASKQQNIAAETLYLYSPLAHRLGLYLIKSELEDLALKYNEPEIYRTISQKLQETEVERKSFIQKFIFPIKKAMASQGITFEIDTRSKSVYSIYKKMQIKEIPFEEVYDLFAVRIIIESSPDQEKIDCWRVYTLVTDNYNPKQNRLRDWISTPKANGYESLHTTVMSPAGQWVEVQIRTRRMHEIAERGYAAHWKYKQQIDKDKAQESGLDDWLAEVRKILKSPDTNTLNFLDDIKLTLFSDEVFVWTPKGHLKSLPAGSTMLDFAYLVHTELGNHCIGVKVNRNLVPLDQKLRSGDQVEVIASKKSYPKEEWLAYAITPRARFSIKEALKEQRKVQAAEGRLKLEEIFRKYDFKFSKSNIGRFSEYMGFTSPADLFYKVFQDEISADKLLNFIQLENDELRSRKTPATSDPDNTNPKSPVKLKSKTSVKYDLDEFNFAIATCCHPLPGDEIIAYTPDGVNRIVHRTNCHEAIELMTRFSNRIIHASWNNKAMNTYLGGIKISGFDRKSMISDIIRVISEEMHFNARSFHIDTSGELFEAYISIFIHDTVDLNRTVERIKQIDGVSAASRMLRFVKT